MKAYIVTITDSIELSRSIDRYLRYSLGPDVDTYYMTYDRGSVLLTGELYRRADLFILGLMRRYAGSLRAEGVPVAEALWRAGKRALVVSGYYRAHEIECTTYWDLGSAESFVERIRSLTGTRSEAFESSVRVLSGVFASYLDHAAHRHRHSG
jgi:hypothetical protein